MQSGANLRVGQGNSRGAGPLCLPRTNANCDKSPRTNYFLAQFTLTSYALLLINVRPLNTNPCFSPVVSRRNSWHFDYRRRALSCLAALDDAIDIRLKHRTLQSRNEGDTTKIGKTMLLLLLADAGCSCRSRDYTSVRLQFLCKQVDRFLV